MFLGVIQSQIIKYMMALQIMALVLCTYYIYNADHPLCKWHTVVNLSSEGMK